MPEDESPPRHHLRRWIIGAVVVIVVLAVAGPFIYIHLIEGPAPAKLSLPGGSSTSGTTPSASTGASTGSVTGVWHVGTGSLVGYRVEEVLIGQHATAVGRSSHISGSVTIAGSTVTAAEFTVAMASVVSDQSERNASFDGRIMDVAHYPTATLTLSAPIVLRTVPAVGITASYPAKGKLAMHGVTHAVSFTVSAERIGPDIDVLADVPIVFASWNIANPSVAGFVTTADTGTLEALLHLTRGAGNAAVTGGSSSTSGGAPGGPVTIPPTTVPPLTIPTGD